jgi:hypothetical protein
MAMTASAAAASANKSNHSQPPSVHQSTSATVVIEPEGKAKGVKVSIDAVSSDGSPMSWGFTTQRDGKEVPVTGNPAYDASTMIMTSPTSRTTVYKKGGKTVMTSEAAISADRKDE